ncbi:hypothetical protein ASE48_13855 [Mycobacterium sp. Root265]|nr:hypothetical protein ASE48_13855 [Mycobacterium sp. Root265]
MLDFLQSKSDSTDPVCRFTTALEEVLQVAGVDADSIDLAAAVGSWPNLDDIVSRLVDRYSYVLDVQVEGEPEDYLVWTGLDVSTTYGAPDLEPDVEHLCVAILMMEGVVRSAPTTNWDGLVEAAMERLAGGSNRNLKVIVAAEDFTAPDRQAELVKFHGCAVRAANDPAEYRDLLIARISQISGWTEKPEHQMMKDRLQYLFAAKPAFIVGLSAQDANIHTFLQRAVQHLPRTWPMAPPAVVFAEHDLHQHHKLVMRLTYGDSYHPNRHEIGESALLGAYAKPALLALVLFTVADKLCMLIGQVTELAMPGPELDLLRADVRNARNLVGQNGNPADRSFMEALVSIITLALWVFRRGEVPNAAPYLALSSSPIADATEDPDYPSAALGRFAVSYALLARGAANGRWSIEIGNIKQPGDGVVRVRTGGRCSKVFIARDMRVLSDLQLAGIIDLDDPEVVVAHAEAIRAPAARSPRTRYGRTGNGGARQIDVESLCAEASCAENLFDSFALVGAL